MTLTVPDEEGPITFAPQKLLGLFPPHGAHIPAAVALVALLRQGVRAPQNLLALLYQGVWAVQNHHSEIK